MPTDYLSEEQERVHRLRARAEQVFEKDQNQVEIEKGTRVNSTTPKSPALICVICGLFFALDYIFFRKSFRPCQGCDILAQILFLALNLRKLV